ncbi:hypothetical protein CRUP_022989 [Coryphaenoides rupestris]|nr:hypothetical protein CRUP_022989 [Coryphaenoides rupestris]
MLPQSIGGGGGGGGGGAREKRVVACKRQGQSWGRGLEEGWDEVRDAAQDCPGTRTIAAEGVVEPVVQGEPLHHLKERGVVKATRAGAEEKEETEEDEEDEEEDEEEEEMRKRRRMLMETAGIRAVN